MNVASVWLQRYGKGQRVRPQIWNARKERKERAKGTAKGMKRQNGKAWLNGTAQMIEKRSGQKVCGKS